MAIGNHGLAEFGHAALAEDVQAWIQDQEVLSADGFLEADLACRVLLVQGEELGLN